MHAAALRRPFRPRLLAAAIACLLACIAAPQAHALDGWRVGLGDKIPTPLMPSMVRGRMPAISAPEATCVILFFSSQESVSRSALARLDAVAQRFGKQVGIIAITDESIPAVEELLRSEEWSGRLNFSVAADPQRHAVRAFFGPQSVPTLPALFVSRGGVVQWIGSARELESVLPEVVAGRWDLAAARRAAQQQEMWDSMIPGIESLARSGDVDAALAKLDAACSSALPAQQAQCSGQRFSILLDAGRTKDALAVGEQILAHPNNDRQPAGLAWALVKAVPGDREALAFALRAAQASDRTLKGRDPMVGAILARTYFLSDRRTDAVATAQRALSLADAPDLRRAIQEDLSVYEGPKKPAAGGAGAGAGGAATGAPTGQTTRAPK